jgi:addiction module RelE/StbE family toxin
VILVWHPLAIEDRVQIMDFIARDKPLAALALDEAFEAHAEKALANPLLYKPGRVEGTREIVVHPNYIVVYRVEQHQLTILRVLHAARKWPAAI